MLQIGIKNTQKGNENLHNKKNIQRCGLPIRRNPGNCRV